ncbi:MAG: hypothetical protein R2911_27645 [Caldilineaceae bacterium]
MLNRCWYHEFDAELAQEFAAMPGLMQWWQQRFAEKLERTK